MARTKYKINTDQQRLPFGGHHLRVHEIVFQGKDPEEVARKIRDYRLANAIPVGDPMEEIVEYYANAFPFMVLKDESFREPVENEPYFEDWRSFIYRIWKNPERNPLAKVEAFDRLLSCKDCKYLVKKKFERTKEVEEIDKKAFLLAKGNFLPVEMGFCSLHKADVGALCFIREPQTRVSQNKTIQSPDHCWVK